MMWLVNTYLTLCVSVCGKLNCQEWPFWADNWNSYIKKRGGIHFVGVVLYAVQCTAYFQLGKPHKEPSIIANTLCNLKIIVTAGCHRLTEICPSGRFLKIISIQVTWSHNNVPRGITVPQN